MKKLFVLFLSVVFLISLSAIAYAHSGGTDSNGGHTNHSTGEYHYHHGYPAHDHYDMDGDGDIDCPYDFDDKTGSDSNSSNSSSSSGSSSNINGNGSYSSKSSSSQPETTEEVKKSVPSWISFIIIGLILALVSLYVTIKDKKYQIAYLESKLKSVKDQHNKDIETLSVALSDRFGTNYLYLFVDTPAGDYIGEDGLPYSSQSKTSYWGEKYTFYATTLYSLTAKYHKPGCRYAKTSHAVNAYQILHSPLTPCAVCQPLLPNMKWVNDYLLYKDIMANHPQKERRTPQLPSVK